MSHDSVSGLFVTARKRSLGQGNIFIGVCQEFCSQGGSLPQCMLGCHPPGADTLSPPGADTPPPREQTHHPPGSRHTTPPGADTPPPREQTPRSRAFYEIRSTRGRYASYWNAFLFSFVLFFEDCRHWQIQGGAKEARPTPVQFLSFSCSLQKSCKIIGFCSPQGLVTPVWKS